MHGLEFLVKMCNFSDKLKTINQAHLTWLLVSICYMCRRSCLKVAKLRHCRGPAFNKMPTGATFLRLYQLQNAVTTTEKILVRVGQMPLNVNQSKKNKNMT